MSVIEKKTNAMRLLEQVHICYKEHSCNEAEGLSGVQIAKKMGEPMEQVFKTLVTVGKSGNHYVFIIPVAEELDLKKAANAADEKNIEMVKSRELLGLTGYIHGGCSPIGMKKNYITYIDETAMLYDKIYVSGGRVGLQIELAPEELGKVIDIKYSDLIKV